MELKLKRIAFLLLVIVAIFPFCSAEEAETMMVSTNQAVYRPGSQVVCAMENLPADSADLRFSLLHLDEIVLDKTFNAENESFSFDLPDKDYVGYLLVVDALNSRGEIIETTMTGIDCSSSWTKFPRYGYLWDYRAITDTTEKIEELCHYHINGLQFYDWQYQQQRWRSRKMIGAILGDMIGSPYEFDRSPKTKEFPLFSKYSQFTDDSVMTVAVADALLSAMGKTDDEIKAALVESMQKWGQKYPDAGYGGMFYRWLRSKQPEPYGSYGNGSAMRVSAAGWLYDTMEETRHIARLTAEVTHNHPEGIKGAEATASAIFMARKGSNKENIKAYIIQEFGYDLSRTCDEIRPTYHHIESCQQTVPEAITAFLEGADFEDVIRTAVSLGGDCDTLTCIACGIAEAFYDIPEEILLECKKRLPDDMLEVIARFMDCRKSSFRDPFLAGNELIEEAIDKFYADSCKKNLVGVLEAIRQRMHADGHFMFPVVTSDDGKEFAFRTIQTNDGKEWVAAFTSPAEHEKGEPSEIISNFIDVMLKEVLKGEHAGFIINPWGQSFMLAKELIEMVFEADGGAEYAVPDDPVTAELLADGSFLKKAVEICNRNRTQMNMVKLMKILRNSWIWVPCNAIMSEADNDSVLKMIQEAEDSGGLDTLVGKTITNQDYIRMVPDILQNGEYFFFPVFSTAEEMGEYGENFSKVQRHFLEAVNLARNNEKKVTGIVINAFTEPLVITMDLLDIIADMDSAIKNPENE